MDRPILIATTNQGKLREIRAIMAALPVNWLSLANCPSMPEAVEDADTFEANAEKKALHYAARAGMWTLADDSGLVVDALAGAPGVRSARFCGTGDDAANNRKLIAELQGVTPQRRTARFVCCIALAEPGAILAAARGALEGRIVDRPRGAHGFGYDPHFWVPELDATTAELSAARKNKISHRGCALRALAPKLSRLLASNPYPG